MKKLTLLSLVGITSIALAHAGWAAGHGGGGGFGGSGFHGGGFGGSGFRGGGFRGGGFGGHFSSMRGGHTFARGGTGTWGGRNWGGNWRHHNHRFSNDVIFIGDFGFPGWCGWGYPYGYYDDSCYGYRYGSRSRHLRSLRRR